MVHGSNLWQNTLAVGVGAAVGAAVGAKHVSLRAEKWILWSG